MARNCSAPLRTIVLGAYAATIDCGAENMPQRSDANELFDKELLPHKHDWPDGEID